MTAARLSRLQRRMLGWILTDHQRTDGTSSTSHQELVQAMPCTKGNLSISLKTLEARGLVTIERTPGGQAESVRLSAEGLKRASQLAGSSE